MGVCYRSEAKLLICVLSISYLASFSLAFDPTDNYLIDCGSPTNTSIGSRIFMSDFAASKFLSTSQDILANSDNITKLSSVDSPLYRTARIFTNTSTYTFSIRRHGRHWIRLYFSPFVYKAYDLTSASFSVFTDGHVLFDSFAARGTSTRDHVVKEFSVNVVADVLVITFAPSANSFAFLNAIEVVSVPNNLITDNLLQTVDRREHFQGISAQALETVARVNMGGPCVSSENDTLSRTWVPDHSFLLKNTLVANISNVTAVKYQISHGMTSDIAPALVYGTATVVRSEFRASFNITWQFNVDQGFRYLVRLHFCDIISERLNSLYFNVFIDSWIVAYDIDISTLSFNSLGSAIHKDYVTIPTVTDKICVSIGQSYDFPDHYPNVILNGLEIMKINNSEGRLSAAVDSLVISSHSGLKKIGVLAICVSIGMLILVALALATFLRMRKNKKDLALKEKPRTRVDLENHIPFLTIQEATSNFDESRVIGKGGFRKVYRGVLNDETKVAIKRKNPGSQQGLVEFRTEIEMLSQFRHHHLVSLIGFCDEENEMILVYEYVENGTLRSRLYGSELPILSWKQRLEICVGAARGLHYLHTGFAKAIIHRDVKSANILLDENLIAKVADFGLSKIGPDATQASHVSTAVKGSFGYFDPEYFRKRRLTVKSDVYSFGVVLFEVLSGRAAVDSTLETEKIGLAGWAMKWQKAGKLEEVIDPALAGEIRANSLRKFGEVAEKCLAERGVDRPSMGEVLRDLECAFKLQEAESIHKAKGKIQHSVSALEMSSHVNDLSSGCEQLSPYYSY